MKEELKIAREAALLAGSAILEIYNDRESDFEIELKADNSPLTKADRAAHRVIESHLAPLGIPILSEEGREIPYAERCGWSRLWVVDPIDGTKEFIKRNGEFTVNIALVEGGVPVLGVVYAPATGELYYGDLDQGAYKCLDGSMQEPRPLALKSEGVEGVASYVVVASRSHLSEQTSEYIESLRVRYPRVELVTKGSSLKICLVAEGIADSYPRYAPTMEWDTAAGDAVLRAAGGYLSHTDSSEPLQYNKENLLNPHFITRRVR